MERPRAAFSIRMYREMGELRISTDLQTELSSSSWVREILNECWQIQILGHFSFKLRKSKRLKSKLKDWFIILSNLKFEQICTKLLDNNFFKTLLILISRLPPRSPSHQLPINSGLNETFVQICALLSINHQRIMALFHGIETDTKTMEWIKCWNFKIFILRIKV